MSREILINAIPGETRVAVTENGALVDLIYSRAGQAGLVGNIYYGRVEKVISSINAAFVDFGVGVSGFLSSPDAQNFDRDHEKPKPIAAVLNEGDGIVVQVTRDAVEEKGAKLTTRLSLAKGNLVLTPARAGVSVSKQIDDVDERTRLEVIGEEFLHRDMGLIFRTRARWVGDDDLRDQVEAIMSTWQEIEIEAEAAGPPRLLHQELDPLFRYLRDKYDRSWTRVVVDDPLIVDQVRHFISADLSGDPGLVELGEAGGADLEDQIDTALSPLIPLPSGGSLIIEETAAFTTVDINSGGQTGGGGKEANALAVNREAMREFARHAMIRNLGGQIVIDLIPLRQPGNRDLVVEELRTAFAADKGDTNVFGVTRMGLVELIRRRRGESLSRQLLAAPEFGVRTPVSSAFDALRDIVRLQRGNTGALYLEISDELSSAFAGPVKASLDSVIGRYRLNLKITVDKALSADQYRLSSQAKI